MLAAPQAITAVSRPSSRSGSKGRDDIEKTEVVENVADLEDTSEKNVRENSKTMCDELNVSCEPHHLNHLEKSDSDEDDEEPEEVS